MGYHNFKCLLCCFDILPGISTPCQDTNIYAINMCSTIRFNVYLNVSRFNIHCIRPYEERKCCSRCYIGLSFVTPGKLYTRKEIVLLETSISEYHNKHYFPEIQKLAFHFPHVSIIGTHCCGKEHHEAFKRWS